MLEINKIYEVEIVDIGHKGEAIGKVDSFTVFVDGAIKGDIVKSKITKSKKNYAVGDLVEIVKESALRVEPKCNLTGICGGCSIMNIDYKHQLELKQSIVVENLKRIAGIENPNVRDIIGMQNPYNYRNKGQFPIAQNGKLEIGFYKKRSHDIVEFDICHIQHENTKEILETIKTFIEENNISVYDEATKKGSVSKIMIRTAFSTDEIMVVIVTKDEKNHNFEKLAEQLVSKNNNVKSVIQNINKSTGNDILGRKNITIFGKYKIIDKIGEFYFEISPNSFYQVNPVQTEVMYTKALEYANLSGEEIVFDFYCGIGTISLFLSQKAKKVYGIEIVEEAIKDAKQNAMLNDVQNVDFIVGKSEEEIVRFSKKGIKADVVMLDPPRKGLDEQVIETIDKMNVKRVVYVSCNPSTMARDIKIFIEKGYKMIECTPVDNFCHSMHVETITLLSKFDVYKHTDVLD